MLDLILQYKTTESLRLQQKVLNDYLVRIVLQIAGKFHKPGRFHDTITSISVVLTVKPNRKCSFTQVRFVCICWSTRNSTVSRSRGQRYPIDQILARTYANHHRSLPQHAHCPPPLELPIHPRGWVPDISI